jgi:hypothetical protein
MDDWLVDFHQILESAAERLSVISEHQAQVSPAEGKWSAKQIIGHLIDSASNNHQRFVRGQFTDDLVFPGYEQETWVAVQHYDDEPWLLLVDFWRLYNLHLIHVMANVPEEVLTKLRHPHSLKRIAWKTVSEDEPVTLEYFMQDYVAHLRHHLDQIFTLLSAPPAIAGGSS